MLLLLFHQSDVKQAIAPADKLESFTAWLQKAAFWMFQWQQNTLTPVQDCGSRPSTCTHTDVL
jgi:hypothetical protein